MFRLPLAGALLLALLLPAFAQSTQIEIGSIFGIVRPYLVEIVGLVIAASLGWLATLIREKFKIEIEARHREALQTALTNSAGLLFQKLDGVTAGIKINAGNPAVAEAVNYALKGAPDAIAYFGITPERVREMLAAKVGVALVAAPVGDA